MIGPDTNEIVHIGAKRDLPPVAVPVHSHLDREKRHVLDDDADPLDRRDQDVRSESLRRTDANSFTNAGRPIGVPR